MLRSLLLVSGLFLSLHHAGAQAAKPFRYPEAKEGKGELKYVNGLPVLKVEGTPREIGQQVAVLAMKPAKKALDYPRDRAGDLLPQLVKQGKALLPNFPAEHRQELEQMQSVARQAGMDPDLLVAANTMFDLQKAVGCSVLLLEPGKSATAGPLVGRNLDYPTEGYLQDYSLVTVYRPLDRHAFVAIGFPGMVGCLSGMNEKGVVVAVLEVGSSSDGADRFDPHGMPYAAILRSVLEECATVKEAEELLRGKLRRRTTMFNLAVCDAQGGAIFEVTPKSLEVRKPAQGVCACTNHFRILDKPDTCRRFDTLELSRRADRLDVAAVQQKLHDVNLGELTIQSMVFEPAARKLHLAIGACPASALKLRTLELEPWFARGK